MNQTIRWGLIGCGDIARKRVAPALCDAEGGELFAVARARPELAQAFAAEFGARKHYADWRELAADPEIDAVYVATPVNVHAEQTIAAAAAGKHVLCEKPIALTAADGERAADACREAEVKFGVAYYRRMYPLVRRIKQLLEEGAIGKPVLARFDAFEKFDPAPGEPRRWLVEKESSGGGPMMDFGCHRVEILLDWFGPPEAIDGYADAVALDRGVEDTSSVQLRFASGVRGEVTVSHAVVGSRDTLEVLGAGGRLAVASLNGGGLTIQTAEGETRESHPPHANLHQPLIEDFLCAVVDDREPAVGADDALAVQRVMDAVYGKARG